MKNFALIGAAGYIAPRHMQAIKDTGNRLIAALDPNDSVGILDRYFDDVAFFKEFERFDRHAEKLHYSKEGGKIDFVSICSPNHLHDAHIRFGLRIGANVICEKPLVINPWNVDALKEIETRSEGRVFTVLQLRYHPSILALKDKVEKSSPKEKFDIELTYITSRGPWYHYSWKGDESKSGGLVTNIGIHFFDMLLWVYGPVEKMELFYSDENTVCGYIELEKARVKWLLSIDKKRLPSKAREKGLTTSRSLTVNNEEVEFSEGFTDLHTRIYEQALLGKGYGLMDARPAIDLVYRLRQQELSPFNDRVHPFLRQ